MVHKKNVIRDGIQRTKYLALKRKEKREKHGKMPKEDV